MTVARPAATRRGGGDPLPAAPVAGGAVDGQAQPLRVTRRRGTTRARLLAAAFEVFAGRGFGRATVEDVCERAGYTRGAFYSNFASLDELFFALYADYATDLVRTVEDAVAAGMGDLRVAEETSAAIDAVVDRVVAALPTSRERYLLNTEFTVHALRHPDVARTLAEHRRALRAALVPVLQVALGTVGTTATAARLDQLARAVIALHEGMATQELLEPRNRTLARLHRRAMSAVVTGTLG